MQIRKAETIDLTQLTGLALGLWPEHDPEELKQELGQLLSREDAAFFLAWEEQHALGFSQCQLRRDYVEGTESSPVGYLEGIYVDTPWRRKGIAKALVQSCRSWAREQGCREFASDCELSNEESLRFHLALGFREAGRIICFTSKL